MSTVLVRVKTDHADPVQAAESVRNAMVRAGYNTEDVHVWGDGKSRDISAHCHALVSVIEPELDYDRTPKTKDENIAFRKNWDERVDSGNGN